MTLSFPEDEADQTVTIDRSALHGCRRVTRKRPPLLRDDISNATDEDLIKVPVPAAVRAEAQQIHVLHVDDNPDLGEVTKLYLEEVDDSITVTAETSVVEALDRLRDGEFDCIISDYDMPNTNGIEFLEIVRDRYPDLPFILFTGKGSEEVASEAIAAGVTDYMQKGVGGNQYEVLANRISNAVEQYRMQQRFWQTLSWYQRLLEQDLTGVFVIQQAEFAYVNERFADIFGYEQSELIGASPEVIVAETDQEEAVATLVEPDCDSVDTFQFEFTGQGADGAEIPLEVQGGTIEYEDEPGCIGILWDFEEQLDAEED
jgi:PAS domain S-box-containing protein